MKLRTWIAALSVAACGMMVGCDDDEPKNGNKPEPEPEPEPIVEEFAFSFAKDTVFMSQNEGFSKDLIDEKKKGNEGEVVCVSDAEWCKLILAGNNETSFSYQISVIENESIEARVAHVTITFAEKELKFCVKQDGMDYVEIVSPKDLTYNCDSDGGDMTIQIDASKEYTVESDKVWVKAQNYVSDNDGKPRTKLTVLENFSTSARTAEITFTCGKSSKTYKVEQGAGTVKSLLWDDTDAASVSRSMGIGWNLGNQMDAQNNGVAGEEYWGNKKATQATFDALRDAGFTSVRIPVTWMGHVGAGPVYEIESAYLDRVAEIVGYAENAGLKAIINIHHDGSDSKYWLNIKEAAKSEDANIEIRAQIEAMWKQIAEKFADKGDFLVFEAFNEIHDGGWGWGDNKNDGGKQYKVLNGWNQLFVNTVRATGGNNATRYLGVPAYCTNIDISLESFVMPKDIEGNKYKILMAVHDYDPYEYTLNAKFPQWGHTAQAGKKESWGDEPTITGQFKKLVDSYMAKGIPVYIGEFGCVHRASTEEEMFRKYYLEYFCKAASDYNLSVMYWDNGSDKSGQESSGIINHATGAFVNNGRDIAEIMVQAYRTTLKDYTLKLVYNGAPNTKK
ncbi:MAG: cellulase family glycosylhydrolase [Bacteroidales bacterium]|nr:cellulase family glycosylhydrolase [Bacteroidales bacterium]